MSAPATVALVVVPAYYLDRETGTFSEALPQNRVLAQPFADKWEAWRKLAQDTYGWELLITAPAAGSDGYTRSMFRTPEDQAQLDNTAPDAAAGVDQSAHQAGRAVDLALADMQATYANYDYNKLLQLAQQVGIDARLRSSSPAEPWHFDDNPRALYGGDAKAAVEAVGNTTDQVQDALAAGVERPEEIAVRQWKLRKLLGVGAAVSLALLLVLAMKETAEASQRLGEHHAPAEPAFKGVVHA